MELRYPSPEDPARAPVWENYIIAQTVQASLGMIPRNALAVGVEVDGASVRLRFQLAAATAEDLADIEDIVSEFQALVGDDVAVDSVYEIREQRDISLDRVLWVFFARFPGD